MAPELHPWLGTQEALAAARKAVRIPMTLLPGLARIVGADELESEALAILAECALPPRDDEARRVCACCGGSLEVVRAGARYCGPKCRDQYNKDIQRSKGGERKKGGVTRQPIAPATPQGYVGSMWRWPEDQRQAYAVRTVGYALNNWLRTRHYEREIASSDTMDNITLEAA